MGHLLEQPHLVCPIFPVFLVDPAGRSLLDSLLYLADLDPLLYLADLANPENLAERLVLLGILVLLEFLAYLGYLDHL